jgi:hypothetical protein
MVESAQVGLRHRGRCGLSGFFAILEGPAPAHCFLTKAMELFELWEFLKEHVGRLIVVFAPEFFLACHRL